MGQRPAVPGVGPPCRRFVAATDDGLAEGWQMADHLNLSHRTVERVIRQVAVQYVKHTAWKDRDEM